MSSFLGVVRPRVGDGNVPHHLTGHQRWSLDLGWAEADLQCCAESGTWADSNLQVVGSFRLDHRRRLAAELGVDQRLPDAALVLTAYRRWGRSCPEYLHGSFAFAVVDAVQGGVLLVTDHVGSRPLAVFDHHDGVSFASSALALTTVVGIDHRIDPVRVAELLVSAIGSDRTMVEGVRRLAPGTCRWIDGSGRRSRRWWQPESIEQVDLGSLDDHAQVLREVFERAVASAVEGHERIGISLSGGLDSAAVAASAALAVGNVEKHRLRGYTAVPPADWNGRLRPGWDRDEIAHVSDLVGLHPSIDVTWIDVRNRDPFGHHEALWELGAPPAVNALNSVWIHAIRDEAMADGVTLLLNGASGNLAFSADGPRVLVELARGGRFAGLAREVSARSDLTGRPTVRVLRRELLTLLAPDALRRIRAGRRGEVSKLEMWKATKLLRSDPGSPLSDDDDLVALLPHLARIDHTDWFRRAHLALAPIAARAEAEAASSEWWGLTHWDPTTDRDVLEVALAQPEWYRRHGGLERAVVRRAMSDRLPASILQRRRRGSQLPDWFDRMTEHRETWIGEAEAARDHPATRELIDVERITSVLRAWPTTDDGLSRDDRLVFEQSIPRALLISRYLRWFEQRRSRIAAGGPHVVLPQRS